MIAEIFLDRMSLPAIFLATIGFCAILLIVGWLLVQMAFLIGFLGMAIADLCTYVWTIVRRNVSE